MPFFYFLFKKRIKEAFFIFLFSLFALTSQLIYNEVFFGSPFKFGYQIFYAALAEPILSLQRWIVVFEKAKFYFSSFVYLFLVLGASLTFFGIKYLLKENKSLAGILISWFLIYFLFYISLGHPGIQPRYFIPAIPPLIFLTVSSFCGFIKS